MVEITYSYYTDEYVGNSVTEEEFPKLLKLAKIHISNRTFGNSDKVEEDNPNADRVKYAVCSVIDTLKAHTDGSGIQHGVLTSESVGNWSRSYKVTDKGATLEDIVNDKIYTLLSGTDLLYGGTCL